MLTTTATVQLAERRQQWAARRLVLAWASAVGLGVAGVLLGVTLTALVVLEPDFRGITLLSLLLSLPGVMLLLRLVPHRPGDLGGVEPDPETRARFADLVAEATDGWRPDVRLVPHADMWIVRDHLVLGMPLVTCLRDTELAELVREARARHLSEQTFFARVAMALAAGELGRGIELTQNRDEKLARRLLGLLDSHIEVFLAARHELAVARSENGSPEWRRAADRVQVVEEAWDFVAQRWLVPALHHGVWYDEPWSALRVFLDTCTVNGVIDDSGRPSGRDVDDVVPIRELEPVVAERMIESTPHAETPSAWDDHPADVTAPQWRRELSLTVYAGSRLTGRTVTASVAALVDLVRRGDGPQLAALLVPPDEATTRRGEHGKPDTRTIERVLVAATSLALLDAGVAMLSWHWPSGSVLHDHEGRVLDVAAEVADPSRILPWLEELGVDATVPLWLGEGVAPDTREEPQWAVNVQVGRQARRLVVSDQALHLFPTAQTRRQGVRRLTGLGRQEEDPAIRAVARGDLPEDVVSHRWRELVGVDLRRRFDPSGWSMHVRTPDGAVSVLKGVASRAEVEQLMRLLLGPRAQLSLAPYRRSPLGTLWYYLMVGMGGLVAVSGLWLVFRPDPEITADVARGMALWGTVALLLGLLPTWLSMLRDRWVHERRHRMPAGFA